MAFKLVVLAACLAVANAGGQASYDITSSSGDHSSIGFTHESTRKGFGGQNVVSSYSKSDDSAHSSVHVSSQSISNDGLLNLAPVVKTTYTAPTYLAPTGASVVTKSYAAPAPLIAKTAITAQSPVITRTYSAPIVAKNYEYAVHSPIYAKSALLAPATYTSIASTPLVARTYAVSPLVKSYTYETGAPFLQAGIGAGLGAGLGASLGASFSL